MVSVKSKRAQKVFINRFKGNSNPVTDVLIEYGSILNNQLHYEISKSDRYGNFYVSFLTDAGGKDHELKIPLELDKPCKNYLECEFHIKDIERKYKGQNVG